MPNSDTEKIRLIASGKVSEKMATSKETYELCQVHGQQIEEIKNSQIATFKLVEKIETAICGGYDKKGILERVNTIETDVTTIKDDHKAQKKWFVGFITSGILMIIGTTIGIVVKLHGG